MTPIFRLLQNEVKLCYFTTLTSRLRKSSSSRAFQKRQFANFNLYIHRPVPKTGLFCIIKTLFIRFLPFRQRFQKGCFRFRVCSTASSILFRDKKTPFQIQIEPESFQNRHLHKRQALVKEEATVSNILARTFPLQIKHLVRKGWLSLIPLYSVLHANRL